MRNILFMVIVTFFALPVSADEFRSTRFAGPTERYQHCVLGDCIEYETVEATLTDGRVLSFHLDSASVFEDITPRLVPLGPDGRKVILVVRSYQDKGAALAVLDLREGKIQIVAESPAIGTANRWQNPVGVADFDGDGRPEIASVITPHIGGMLTLYEWRGGALVEDGRIHGFSNHQYGSVILDLHEIMDWNGDGVPDIILPDAARRALKVLSFAEGEADMLAEYPLNSPVKGPVTATQTGVAIVLQDDRVISWKKSGL